MHTEITDLEWSLRKPDNVGIISFKFRGFPCQFREPLDVIIGNNTASKKWIVQHYGDLLETLDPQVLGDDIFYLISTSQSTLFRKEDRAHAE